MVFTQKVFHYGLLAGPESIALAEVREEGDQVVVGNLSIHDRNQSATVLKEKVSGVSILSCSLPSRFLLMRPLKLKLSSSKEIEQVYASEAEQLLPYPIADAVVDYQIADIDQTGASLTISSVKKEHLNQELAFWEKLGVTPEKVIGEPLALGAVAHRMLPLSDPYFVLHASGGRAICVLMNRGVAVAGSASTVDEDGEKGLEHWLAQACFSLSKQCGISEPSRVLLLGDSVPEIEGIVQDKLSKEVIEPDLERFPDLSLDDLRAFAIPIGLALLGGKEKGPNFRKGEFSYPLLWKRAAFSLSRSLILALILALVSFGLGKLAYHKRLDGLRLGYVELQELASRVSLAGENDSGLSSSVAASLEPQEIMSELERIRGKADALSQAFPLVPSVPRVSDVLAWLSSLPNLSGGEGKSGIELKTFNYRMLKRPTNRDPTESYQVQVDIEVVAASPQQAREFHEALLDDRLIVDQGSRISWSVSAGRYLASFKLRQISRGAS